MVANKKLRISELLSYERAVYRLTEHCYKVLFLHVTLVVVFNVMLKIIRKSKRRTFNIFMIHFVSVGQSMYKTLYIFGLYR